MGKGALQFLQLASSQWKVIDEFSPALCPLHLMRDKLLKLKELLSHSLIECWLWEYGFFDANLIPELSGRELFDFPLFLAFTGSDSDMINQLIVYDVRDECYHLIRSRGVWKTNASNNPNAIFSSFVLDIEQILLSVTTPDEVVSTILLAIESDTKTSAG